MNRLLLSSILVTGLALGASGVFAADQYRNSKDEIRQSENYRQNSSDENFGSQGGEYTVRSGDTLSSIAEAELGSEDRWQEIALANDINNPDRIYAGQTLTIPAGQSGIDATAYETAGQERSAVEVMVKQNESRDNDIIAKSGEDDGAMNKAPDHPSMDRTQQELKGEIMEISTENKSFSLKDEQGMTHFFTKFEDDHLLEKVSVGDFVKVEIENGTVVSLEKVDRSA